MLPFPRVLCAATRIAPALSAHGPGRPHHHTYSDRADPPRQKVPCGSGSGGVDSQSSAGPGPSTQQQQQAKSADSASRLVQPEPKRPASIVHAALESRSPMEPRSLLAMLASRPHLLSPEGVTALDAYAKRTNDLKVQRDLRALLNSERAMYRPPTVERTPKDKWKLRDKSSTASWVDDTYVFDRWVPYRESGVIPNRALYGQFPPLSELPSGPVSPDEFVRHQHYLHLKFEPYELATAVQTILSVKGDAEHILQLALAYTTGDPVSILDHPAAASIRRSRQTLHLAVLAHLRRHRPLPSYVPVRANSHSPTDSTASASAPPPTASTNDPTTLSPQIATQSTLQSLINKFTKLPPKLRRTPGSETWRHIALHGLEMDDEPLSHWAYTHAKSELHRAYNAETREREYIATRRYDSKALVSPVRGTRNERKDVPVPVAKFAHLGRMAMRWERVMQAFRGRGWAVRCSESESESEKGKLIDNWRWREEGEVVEDGSAPNINLDTLDGHRGQIRRYIQRRQHNFIASASTSAS